MDQTRESEWEEDTVQLALERVRVCTSPRRYQVFDCYIRKGWPVERVARILGVGIPEILVVSHVLLNAVRREIRALNGIPWVRRVAHAEETEVVMAHRKTILRRIFPRRGRPRLLACGLVDLLSPSPIVRVGGRVFDLRRRRRPSRRETGSDRGRERGLKVKRRTSDVHARNEE